MMVAIFSDIIEILGIGQYPQNDVAYMSGTCTLCLPPARIHCNLSALASRSSMLFQNANLLRIDRSLKVSEIGIWIHRAQKYGFELVHTSIGEEKSGICKGHHRGRRY